MVAIEVVGRMYLTVYSEPAISDFVLTLGLTGQFNGKT